MSTSAASATGTPRPRASHHRWLILAMLFLTVVINYMDRANLSIAMPAIASDLKIDTVKQGLVLSAFGWTYAFLQIPGGWFIDHVKPRILYPLCLLLWSLSTLCMGFAGSFLAIFALRLLVGIFEAPAYPINNKVATMWFPEKERASAIGIYTSGQFIGLAILTPVLTWLQHVTSWHWVFVVTGTIGIVWGVLWYLGYRAPLESRRTNEAEIEHLRSGNALVDLEGTKDQKKEPFRWSDFLVVMSSRKLWGIYLGQFCLTSTMWFFLTWFPTYLVKYRHMNYIKSGFLVSLPYVAAMVGVVVGGLVSDYLMRRGVSLGTSRKIPIIGGLLLSTAIIGANFTSSTALVITCMTIAFFGNGFASITWSLVSALAPKRLLGLTGGMFNFIGNMSSIATPIVIGALITPTSFAPAFIYMTIVTLLGIFFYAVLVGKVTHRIQDPRVPDEAVNKAPAA